MSEHDKRVIMWYRNLETIERLAIHAWLLRNDGRLVAWLRPARPALRVYDLDCLPRRVLLCEAVRG